MLTGLLFAGFCAGSPPAEFAERGKSAVVAGNVPAAILVFRQGLAEHPGDRELGDLLEAARDLIGYPPAADAGERMRPPPQSNWDRWVGAWELTAIGVGFAALAAAGLAGQFTHRYRWAVPLAAVGLIGVVGVVAVMVWPRQQDERVAVVVAERGAVLRTGNADSYPSRTAYPLPRGAELTILGHRGGWAQVQLAGGAVGWVREGEIQE